MEVEVRGGGGAGGEAGGAYGGVGACVEALGGERVLGCRARGGDRVEAEGVGGGGWAARECFRERGRHGGRVGWTERGVFGEWRDVLDGWPDLG